MFPTILELGPFTIRSYGLLLAVSFLVGISYSARRASRDGLNPDRVIGLTWILILLGVIGARMMYVIQHPGDFSGAPLEILRVWRGGLTLYGGLILAIVGGFLYLRWRTRRPWRYADAMAPFISLGEGISRVGCFLNGCCFGTPSTLPWALQFPDDCVAGHSPIAAFRLHPTQIYASIFGLMLFLFLRNRLFKKHFTGEVFALYLIFSGLFRFGIDFLRFYEDGANLWVNQIIALGTAVAGVIIYVRSRRANT